MLTGKRIVSVLLLVTAVFMQSCSTADIDERHQELESSFFNDSMSLLNQTVSDEQIDVSPDRGTVIPEGYKPWWTKLYAQPLLDEREAQAVMINDLVPQALAHSFQIKTFSDIPLIRSTTIDEAKGAFDTRFFVKGRYDEVNEPVGSTLRTGGAPIFEEESSSIEVGLKKKIFTGGEIEVSQRIGFVDNNSDYFDPAEQAQTRLSVNYTQPLLRGAGKFVNESQIVLATLDSRVGHGELRRQAESFILELHHAYWSLYLERTYLVQKRGLAENAGRQLAALKQRANVDTLESQIARAQAEYASIKADLVEAEKAVRNAESRLRTLSNVPELYQTRTFEPIPLSGFANLATHLNVAEGVRAALLNRPEIDELLLQMQASSIREKVARNQKLPTLNFLLEAYHEGLAGDNDLDGAIDSQQSGDLSYMVGVIFDMPLSSQSARARHLRRKLEGRQLFNKLRVTAETIVLEVQMSAREVEAAYREAEGQYETMMACRTEYDDLHKRQSVALEGGAAGSEHLERLLGCLQRLTEAEGGFARSMVTYQLAYWNWERAKGNLLNKSRVAIVEEEVDGMPVLQLRVIPQAQE